MPLSVTGTNVELEEDDGEAVDENFYSDTILNYRENKYLDQKIDFTN